MINIPESLQVALLKILRPLVHLMLRNGVSFADFVALGRHLYVDVASKEPEFQLKGKQTATRIAVVTGLNRKEVKRVLDSEDGGFESDRAYVNRAVRVLGGWTTDTRFLDSDSQPKTLLFDREQTDSEFEQLVKAHAGDLSAKSILDELIRVKAVTVSEQGEVSLVNKSYIPSGNDEELLRIGSQSISDLIGTVSHNIHDSATRLQVSIDYDNIPGEGVTIYRSFLKQQADPFRQQQKDLLASLDRDTNPESDGSGRNRVGVGLYYIEEQLTEAENKN